MTDSNIELLRVNQHHEDLLVTSVGKTAVLV
jgi:hypothetical protein